jgi:NADH-quinone oxidoreductase subunit M
LIELHLPWLDLAILTPLGGAAWVCRLRNPDTARRHSLIFCGLAMLAAIGAWQDFRTLHTFEAHDRWDLWSYLSGSEVFVIDELSAPLLPLASLLYLLTHLATLRTKIRRYSFAWSLVAESILLATLSCRQPWILIGLLAAGTVHPVVELRARGKPQRVYVLHMAAFVALLVGGQALLTFPLAHSLPRLAATALLMAAVLIRSGIFPTHCWMADLCDKASFGTALLFVTPMVGAYAAMRLVLPIAPDWALRGIANLSLFTSVYAAGMAFVQQDARRFFCYLFLSHSSLVLVGLEIATAVGLTGALCVWLSVGLALSGFALTLRSVEARIGPVSFRSYHGLYAHSPMLAALFLLTGLASIGFPGTVGFIGTELLVEGAVEISPMVGVIVVLVAALNSLAVLHAYFRIFTGRHHVTSINLRTRRPEALAVLTLALLILGGGLYPQPGVASRFHAATKLIEIRRGVTNQAMTNRPGSPVSPRTRPRSLAQREPKPEL